MQSLKDLALMLSEKKKTEVQVFFKRGNMSIISPGHVRKSNISGVFMIYLA